eukprot:UN21257
MSPMKYLTKVEPFACQFYFRRTPVSLMTASEDNKCCPVNLCRFNRVP